jgi:hypothetical protein
MFAPVQQALELLEKVLDQLGPERLGRAASIQMCECFAKIETLAAAGKALCALRAADSQAWWGHRAALAHPLGGGGRRDHGGQGGCGARHRRADPKAA